MDISYASVGAAKYYTGYSKHACVRGEQETLWSSGKNRFIGKVILNTKAVRQEEAWGV